MEFHIDYSSSIHEALKRGTKQMNIFKKFIANWPLVFGIVSLIVWAHHEFKIPNLWDREREYQEYQAELLVVQYQDKIPVDTLVITGNRYKDKSMALKEAIDLNREYSNKRNYKIIDGGVAKLYD